MEILIYVLAAIIGYGLGLRLYPALLSVMTAAWRRGAAVTGRPLRSLEPGHWSPEHVAAVEAEVLDPVDAVIARIDRELETPEERAAREAAEEREDSLRRLAEHYGPSRTLAMLERREKRAARRESLPFVDDDLAAALARRSWPERPARQEPADPVVYAEAWRQEFGSTRHRSPFLVTRPARLCARCGADVIAPSIVCGPCARGEARRSRFAADQPPVGAIRHNASGARSHAYAERTATGTLYVRVEAGAEFRPSCEDCRWDADFTLSGSGTYYRTETCDAHGRPWRSPFGFANGL